MLSAFSGLKDFGLSFSNSFEPQFRVEPFLGKTLILDSLTMNSIRSISDITAATPVIEEKVFLSFRQKNHVAYLKGIDSSYHDVISVKDLLGAGQWFDPKYDEVVVGAGIANVLSLGVYDYNDFLILTTLKKKSTGLGLLNPFKKKKAMASGIFNVGEEIDKKYLFANIKYSRELFQISKDHYSYIDLKTNSDFSSKILLKKLTPFFSDPIVVKSRKELNPAFYKMLNTENITIYFIFTLIIVIALFNVIGSLIMMILEKTPQLKILYAIGATRKEIRKVFFYLGLMISWVGGFVGIIIGSVLLLIQYYKPFLYVPGTLLPYPVSFEIKDLFLVVLTLFLLGGLTSFWVTSNLNKIL